MKASIARQPLVPAFLILVALTTAVLCFAPQVAEISPSAGEPESQLGGLLTGFQTAYPVLATIAGALLFLLTGLLLGRLGMRYNLYSANTCLPIPLFGMGAYGILFAPGFLVAATSAYLLTLSLQHFARAYSFGYGFDAIFRGSLYLGLLPLIYAPGILMLLLMPLAILIFHRTLRELAVATTGVVLPLLTACYLSWGFGGSFLSPLMQFGPCFETEQPLALLFGLSPVGLILTATLVTLTIASIFFFLSDMYAVAVKSRYILIYNISMFLLLAGMLCLPCASAPLFALLAIPAALLLPVMFVRIHPYLALVLYLLLLCLASAGIASM